jgi:hypothetical protein
MPKAKRAAIAAPAGAAPPAAQDAQEAALVRLLRLKKEGLMSNDSYEAAVRAELLLPPAAAVAVNAPAPRVALEEAATTADRQIATIIRSWSGSVDAPLIRAEFWVALTGDALTPHLAQLVTTFKASKRLNSKFLALFVSAGEGVTPALLLGPGEDKDLLRLSARQFIVEALLLVGLELVSAYFMTAHQIPLTAEMTATFATTLRATVAAEDHEIAGASLFLALSKKSAAVAAETRPTVTSAPKGITCTYCKRPGHDAVHCRSAAQDRAAQDRGRNFSPGGPLGGRGRGAGRGRGRGQ